jgi:outer membrane biosynthesis protein TonB
MSHYVLQFSLHFVSILCTLQLVHMCIARPFCSLDGFSKTYKSESVLSRSHDTVLLDAKTQSSNWVSCGPSGVNPRPLRLRGGAARPADPSAESEPDAPPPKPKAGKIKKAAKSAPSKEESQDAQPTKPAKAPKAASKAKAAPERTESPDAAPVKAAKTTKSKAKSKTDDAYSVISCHTMLRFANALPRP